MRDLLQLLQFLLVIAVTFPIALVPHKLSLGLGRVLGELLFLVWKSRRSIAIENLRGAIARAALSTDLLPEAIIRRNFGNLGKSFVEVLKIYYGLGGRVFKGVEIAGAENFEQAKAKGSGVIFITGHCGNWELMAVALSIRVTRIDVVARQQDNPYFNRFIESTRKKYGNSVIYKKGALKKILASLKVNGVVGILMDQSVVRSEGVMIDFLGKEASTLKMPAMIARKTGAAVLPLFIRRTDKGHVIEIGREIEPDRSEELEKAVLNDTIRYTGYIEQYIRQNPSEWLWIHRRWKSR